MAPRSVSTMPFSRPVILAVLQQALSVVGMDDIISLVRESINSPAGDDAPYPRVFNTCDRSIVSTVTSIVSIEIPDR